MVDFGRSRIAKVLLSIFLVSLVGTALPAAADPQDRLEDIREQQEKVDARINELEAQSDELLGKIGELDAERAKVDRKVDDLDAELHDLQLRIDEVRDDLADAQHRISLLEKRLQEILSDLQARTDVYTGRAVAIYKAGPTVYVDGLLDSENFAELFDRFAYYRASVDADSELIAEIQVLRDQTTTRREQVESERARIAEAKLRLEQDKTTLAEARRQQAILLAEREAALSEKEAILTEVQSRKSSAEAVADQLDRDAAEMQSLLASSGSSSGGVFPTGGGQFGWPAAGAVTSPYGYRIHPIFGDRRLHTGLDIGAPYAAPIVAAGDGTVVYAGVMGGYGNVVVVDHGGGLSTTYNHMSSFQVGSGQSVSRGSQVGSVGCTGYCTGPHLHFEVRVNGATVDPMPYLQ